MISKSVVAMDGGGTNLRVTAISHRGRLRKNYRTGVNLTAVTLENLISVFEAVKIDLGEPDVLLAAFSGAGDRERETKLLEALRTVFKETSIEVMMDIEGLYRAAVGRGSGLVVISGTGSTVYGHDSSGTPVRAGGWGHVFDDEGSGFWIAKEIIVRALRYRDGLSTFDPVFDLLLKFYEVETVEKLVNLTLLSDFKTKIASFSRVALENPSPIVREVLEEGIAILARRTLKVIEKIGSVGTIQLYGGSFQCEHYREKFVELIGFRKTSLFQGNVDEILADQAYENLNKF